MTLDKKGKFSLTAEEEAKIRRESTPEAAEARIAYLKRSMEEGTERLQTDEELDEEGPTEEEREKLLKNMDDAHERAKKAFRKE